MNKFYLLISCAFFLVINGFSALAQNNLQKAWAAFYANKRADARMLFTEAATGNDAAEAYLGLSLLAQMDKGNAESFGNFVKFCSIQKDPQAYIYALWTTPSVINDYGKKSADQLLFLKTLAGSKNYDGMLPAMAGQVTGKHYEVSKQFQKADEAYATTGSINNWLITGEFENISTSGFDKRYDDVIAHPEASATFRSKYGAQIRWHKLPAMRHDHWVDYEYYNSSENSIEFAQTFINSDVDQEAQLRIGVSGSVKVWLNDALVLSEAEERNNDLDSYIRTVKLNKGYNRVLVQIGESYCNSSNFMVRITNSNGYALKDLSFTDDPQPYTKMAKHDGEAIEPYGIAYFKAKINKDANDDLSKILLAQAYLRSEQTYEVHKILNELLAKYPQSTYLNLMLLQLFNRESNRTGAETLQEAIKTYDPHSSQGLIYKYNEVYGQKNFEKAAEIVKELEENYPHLAESIYGYKIAIAYANKNQNEIVSLGEEAYQKFPDNADYVKLKYAINKELHKNSVGAMEVLKKYVDNNDNYSMAKELSQAYFAAGNTDLGYKVLETELVYKPYATGIYSYTGTQYYNQHQYGKAFQDYLKCIEIAPTISTYYTSLGQISEMMGDKEKAVGYYKKGLEINPSNYESIQSLRKIENKKDVFSYFKTPDLDQLIKNAPNAADYPDDNSVILNEETQKVVYEQGGAEARKILTLKILTQKGIESWKEYNIDTDSWQELNVENADVIKANGTKVPAERNNNSIVFTNLEVGDVIDLRYKVQDYERGKLAGYFWDSFYFSHGKPYVTAKYSLLISKNQKFNNVFSQRPITPVKTSADEFDMYVWENKKQPAITYEDKMPPLNDVANVLYITSIPDWKFISEWYNDLGSAKARSNYEVKQVVNDLFKGKPGLTEMQKIEKIYNYITNNISYSSVSFRQSGLVPQNPSTVINTRIGDCKDVSTLFVAMCKEVGIPAKLVLVKTRDNGLLPMPLPSIDFNHCMAKVNVDAKDYYIELTSQYLPFKCLYESSINSTLLDIANEAAAPSSITYLHPFTRKENNVKRNTSLNFTGKNILVAEDTYETGSIAGSLRESFGDLSQKDRVKKIKEMISTTYPDVDVTSLAYKNIEKTNPTDTVYLKLNYALNNTIKSFAGLSVFNLPWSSKAAANNLVITSPRTSGIDLSQMYFIDNDVESITITIPAGKKIVEQILPVVYDDDIISYSMTSKQLGNKLTITRNFKLKKDFVPVDKVDRFNAIFKKMVESDNKELAMR